MSHFGFKDDSTIVPLTTGEQSTPPPPKLSLNLKRISQSSTESSLPPTKKLRIHISGIGTTQEKRNPPPPTVITIPDDVRPLHPTSLFFF